MQFQKLIIDHILTFEHAEIDFSVLPDLYLITGPTGAGKSTILDAICLALYKDAPRLSFLQSGTSQVTQLRGDVQFNANSIQQFISIGFNKGYCSLSFISNDGEACKAELTLNISNKNKISSKWTLRVGEVEHNQVTEIKALISSPGMVGLDFAKFSRSVLLPQGQFSNFIDSKSEDKGEIIESFFDVQRYTQIGAKIHQLYVDCQKEVEKIKIQLGTISPMSDEEVQTRKDALARNSVEINRLNVQIGVYGNYAVWLENWEGLQQQQKKLQQALNAVGQSCTAVMEQQVACFDSPQTQQAITHFRNIEQAQSKWQQLTQKKENVYHPQFSLLCSQLLALKHDLEQQKRKVDEAKQQLAKYTPNRQAVFDRMQTIQSDFKQLNQLEPKATSAKDKLAAVKKAKSDGQQQLEVAKTAVEGYQKELSDLKSQKQQAEQNLQDLGADQLEKRQNILSDWQRQCIALEGDLMNMCLLDKSLSSDSSLADVQALVQTAQQQWQTAKADVEKYQSVFNSLQLSTESAAKEFRLKLRERLKNGEVCTCPVCNQKVEQVMEEGAFESVLDVPRQQLQQSQQAVNPCKAKVDALQQALEQKKQINQKYSKELPLVWQKVREAGCELPPMADVSDWNGRECAAQKQQLAQQQQQLKILNEQAATLRKAQKDLSTQFDKVNSELFKKQNDQNKAQRQVEENADKEEKIRTLITELDGYLSASYPQWQTQADVSTQLQQQTTQFQQLQLVVLDSHLPVLQEQYKAIHTVMLSISEGQQWEYQSTPKATTVPAIDALQLQLNQLNNNIAQLNNECASQNGILEQSQKALQQFYQANPSVNAPLLAVLSSSSFAQTKAVVEQKRTAQTALDNNLKQCNEWQDKQPATLPDRVEGASSGYYEEQKQELTRQLGDLNTQCGSLNSELAAHEKQMASQQNLQQNLQQLTDKQGQWELLNSKLGDSRFRDVALSFLMGNVVNKANRYLSDDFFGANFRVQLSPNPDPKQQLNLQVAFTDNLSQSVGTNCLSGGQRFILSLALALSLGASNKCDTLFIDEGFGTLDDTYLDHVLTGLQRLGGGIAHVGIISHVDKLQQIAAKIEVKPVAKNRSQLVLPY